MLKKLLLSFFIFNFSFLIINAQTPKSYTSSEILLQLKKLNVLGSVLYIAAHPDDENTRLLAYLANGKLYRTGYLSLTRGDGGQNLIGDEQGVDLGLIRTQELLSARRIDGAEQFFSRAFDFGYSKSPDEALRIWGHDKILSDVVWVIRKFRPDVIITRFPTTGEGVHGHHTASAIIAGEAFDAAADSTKFPEQLRLGVTVWQAKRLLWNTFNFGNTNTQNENQFKLDCGDYNPFLGKSYGEIAATSRSQHKSQGFGVAAQRGSVIEYFKTIKGGAPVNDLMDGVNVTWNRLSSNEELNKNSLMKNEVEDLTDSIIKTFSVEHPEKSVEPLILLYKKVETIKNVYWKEQKLNEIKKAIENCSGLFMEATTSTQYAVQGDSLKINFVINNRLGANIYNADVKFDNNFIVFDKLKKNVNAQKSFTTFIKNDAKLSQPYWLENTMEKGSFTVNDQQQIGKAENDPLSVEFTMMIDGTEFTFTKPIRYKYTDPVKGELYQPVNIIPAFSASSIPKLAINGNYNEWQIKSFKDQNSFKNIIKTSQGIVLGVVNDTLLAKYQSIKISGGTRCMFIPIIDSLGNIQANNIHQEILYKTDGKSYYELLQINYDHIPSISYTKPAMYISRDFELKIAGSLVGYIPGAGDKILEALMQMGYKVVVLNENDLKANNLKQFDALVTGVRAYNIHDWLNNSYDELMQYVKDGGVLLVQYNTNNSIGPVKAKISPFPFTITNKRITDEEAKVNFLLPNHPALNYPNKITEKDFEGWIQERSIYHAENIDSNYKRILSMKDPGENEHDGSLIIANYGKGRFIYTGLVFFRELPAGVPGAYRLFANLIAASPKSLSKEQPLKKKKK